MKERPRIGDHVEFRCRKGVRIGRVIAVAVTGIHFRIEMPIGYKYRHRMIGLDSIIRILPEVS